MLILNFSSAHADVFFKQKNILLKYNLHYSRSLLKLLANSYSTKQSLNEGKCCLSSWRYQASLDQSKWKEIPRGQRPGLLGCHRIRPQQSKEEQTKPPYSHNLSKNRKDKLPANHGMTSFSLNTNVLWLVIKSFLKWSGVRVRMRG